MRMLFLIAGLAYGVYLFTGGSLGTDSIFGPPETLPLSRYDDIDVSVYFYYPDETERYLGDVRGASACGDVAYDYASGNGLRNNPRWSYICCTHEDGSDCYRKIR
jgi:hypothetical protein|tara:strand:- start:425 stop:739 length:315 start_codon:yes stop_codon:yes gene_type:complete